MTKQPWELRADEYRKMYDGAKTEEQRKALRDAGFIGNWQQQIFEAVKAGKDVPEQIANGVVSVVEYRAKQALRTKYGDDYAEQLTAKAANVHPIHDIVRINEDGSLTVRRRQDTKGAFHEHKKCDVVVMSDGTGQIVTKAKKPYKLMTGQGLYGYVQDITVRPPRKTEEQTVRQAIAAKSAIAEDQHQSRNQDYADLKREQMDKYTDLVTKAFD